MIIKLLLVFIACIGINTIKTVRKISEIEGHKRLASLLIGLDTLLFMFIIADIISNDLGFIFVISMASGYILGYWIGTMLEEKIALGKVSVTIKIPKHQSKELWKTLRENGFIFIRTQRVYSHKNKPRKMYEGIIYRQELPKLKNILRNFNLVAHVQPIKDTFGKTILTSDKYLKHQSN